MKMKKAMSSTDYNLSDLPEEDVLVILVIQLQLKTH